MDSVTRGIAYLGALAAIVVVSLAAASTAGASDTGKQLRAALDEVMSAPEPPPGIAVLIQRGDDIQYLRRGEANVETGQPPRRNQHYRVASMAKAFNGAVALALVSKGKLELDDTIGEVLPGVLPLAEDVTLAQALIHTGSLPDYIRDEDFVAELLSDPAQYMTPLELLEFVAKTEPMFDPGERYEYSDTDNVIVALMAEEVTGKTYDELLERHVYSKAGLTETSLPVTIEMPTPFMHGYEVPIGAPPEDVSEFINPALAWASGGLVSTIDDVNRFFRAYVGGDLFDRQTRKAQRDFIIGSSSPPGPGRNRATLGLFRYETHCGTVLGHTGSFPGYRLFAASSRNGRRSVVFTANAQIVPGSGSQETSDLIRHAQVDAVCHALR
jgi:D-alanyl-D-alanine carboxypeptidase